MLHAERTAMLCWRHDDLMSGLCSPHTAGDALCTAALNVKKQQVIRSKQRAQSCGNAVKRC